MNTDITIFQVIILTAWSFWGIIDVLSFNFGFNNAIVACLFTGIMVGNVNYGLVVGGTLQLTQLGVGTYGGASIPSITPAGMITTALGAASGANPVEMAASIGILISSLLIQLDVLARFANTAFQHISDRYVTEGNEHGIIVMNYLGIIPWGLSRALPVFFLLLFGQGVVDTIVAVFPTFLMNGFRVAGGLLPVVGFSILMKYLPVQKKFEFLLLGFVLAAYLSVPILGIGLIGLALALMEYKKVTEKSQLTAVNGGGDDYEE